MSTTCFNFLLFKDHTKKYEIHEPEITDVKFFLDEYALEKFTNFSMMAVFVNTYTILATYM